LDSESHDPVQAQEVLIVMRISAAGSEKGRRELSKMGYNSNRVMIV
jgi:hypothetical protein